MAIELSQVTDWLDSKGLRYKQAEQHPAAVHLMFGDDDFDGYVKIELEEDGELIQFYCNQIVDSAPLRVKDHEHELHVLKHLLDLNYQEKFGTWEVDPSDGEVRFAVEIPLEDNTLTEKQFMRMLGRTLKTQENFEQINQILETGELPGGDESEAELLMKLLKMLEEAKAKSGKADKADEDGI